LYFEHKNIYACLDFHFDETLNSLQIVIRNHQRLLKNTLNSIKHMIDVYRAVKRLYNSELTSSSESEDCSDLIHYPPIDFKTPHTSEIFVRPHICDDPWYLPAGDSPADWFYGSDDSDCIDFLDVSSVGDTESTSCDSDYDIFSLDSFSSSDDDLNNDLHILSQADVQTCDFDTYKSFDSILFYIKKYFSANKAPIDQDFIAKLFEDCMFLIGDLARASGPWSCYSSLAHFVKHRTGVTISKSFAVDGVSTFFKNLFHSELQSNDGFFQDFKKVLNNYSSFKKSKLYEKLYRLVMYLLSLSIFEKIGINFDMLRYTKIEAEAIKKKYYMGLDFIHSLLDTVVFICERGYQCMITGSLDPLYHSGSEYDIWFEKAMSIKNKSNFLSNPEPHGFDRFSYLADLNDHIEKGEAIYKHASSLGLAETKLIGAILNDLRLLKSNDCSKRAAQQERKAPFSVLVHGGSSVGKSTFTKLLFYHYGKLFNLPIGDEFKYTRNAIDDYWVNFNTSQWCVQLDDIAFMHPNKATNGDPTLMEMLQVVNNVPFVPIQADLADKGKTPLISRFVVATTNTINLNAYAYFSCPFAVQRRLPFVITIEPKEEYAKEAVMLDGSTLPELDEGSYPNFWNIRVCKVVPGEDKDMKYGGTLRVIHNFIDIYEFLSWFSSEAMDFEDLQDKAMLCDKVMSQITLCNQCHLPEKHCQCSIENSNPSLGVQSEDNAPYFYRDNVYRYQTRLCMENYQNSANTNTNVDKNFLRQCVDMILLMCIHLYFKFFIFRFLVDRTVGPSFLFREAVLNFLDPRRCREYFHQMGDKINKKLGAHKQILGILAGLTSALIMYKTYAKLSSYLEKEGMIPQTFSSDDDDDDDVSNKDSGRAPDIDKDTNRTNVWYKDDYETTSFDITPVISSLKGLSLSQYRNILLRNCVHFRSYKSDELSRPVHAICVVGHIYMCNEHGLPNLDKFYLKITQQCQKNGVNSNIKILVTSDMITRYPERDIAFIELRCLPPKKNIVQFFAKDTFRGKSKGYYLSRNEDGSVFQKNISNIRFEPNMIHDILQITKCWFGKVDTPTVMGDCGSLMVADTPVGPIILGLHALGVQLCVAATTVSCDFIQKFLDDRKAFIVQSGEPMLSAPGYEREFSDLHSKSPIRYIPDGTANVYGSFLGFRPKHKSSVGPTFIQKEILKRGYVIAHGRPVMSGWEPWRKALLDMVRPVTQIDISVLNHCVSSFSNDILSRLSEDKLSEVHVYDTFTAINGANGVLYIDKMNRSTSAGNPFKCSKKYFYRLAPKTATCEDPIEVSEEILSRAKIMEDRYKEGKRCMPNFCAHLKDEAVTFKKIRESKTRVFTGAPFDWSIVVRKYLLSVVKLIQTNRFIFESAPGTIAQSTEWDDIRKYLTTFGDANLIAGDYGKFDKRMPAVVILAAFDIIKNICAKAGYSEAELQVVCGIAEDTAFPLVDMNGDLVEFFGSNPSGHPLTVIINGLANSLYMRYCYTILNPNKNCSNFQENVHLITYGDDNTMGVSRNCPWFNHTVIKQVLSDIDIEYTMADKEALSIPYIHIDSVTFLKRSWRYEKELGVYVCPLDHDSINKMLTVCVASKTVSPEHQSIAIISTAIREYFWYGKEIFLAKTDLLKEVVVACKLQDYVEDSTFPTWESLVGEFKMYSRY